jgi:pSer/pThr/pTyr-binding forkhead associated (FHA) protein
MDTKKFRDLMRKNKQKTDDDNLPIVNRDTKQSGPLGILSFLSEDKEDFELNAKSVRIGKDPKSDILVKSFAVGKTAAIINRLPDGWHISYVGGLSQPRLNNKILKKSAKLKNFDIISLGSAKLQFLIL